MGLKRLSWAVIVLGSLVSGTAASGATLRFNITYGSFSPGVTESFDINTAQVGTPSVNEDAGADFGDFSITHDSLGYTLLQVSIPPDSNFFATADNDYDATFSYAFPYTFLTTQIYDPATGAITAYAGETFEGVDGALVSVSTVPEPATWAQMLAGLAGLGAAVRSRPARVRPA